jgi:hypothetical protein
MQNLEKRQDFALRSAAWQAAYMEPMAQRIRDFAALKGRGKPPLARVYLRGVAEEFAEHIAMQTLSSIVQGTVQGDSLTALASKTGRAVAKLVAQMQAEGEEQATTGETAPAVVEVDTDEEAPEGIRDGDMALAVGYWLVSLACEVTEAAKIVDQHGDRPQKVEGGVKLFPSYELVITDGKFLADAAEFGAVGMPTYSKTAPRAWTDQASGGVDGQRALGMVHGARRQMRGVTSDNAPALFDAVNAAQGARFRVNETVGAVVVGYDPAKAMAWLLEHFMEQGMGQDEAKTKARELARI